MSRRIEPRDLAACRALLRNGSKSFFAASLLLPRQVREPATALYAFCRVADDAVDETDDPRAAVARLHARLDAVYGGRPAPNAVDRALAAVVADFDLPRAHLDALLDGFLWDAEGRRYATISDLRAYAARVAGTVGVMMTLLMGERAPATLARACDLGVAMQLTNIARDVGDDARAGRLYLPADWMRDAGIAPEAWLSNPRHDERLGVVVARMLAEAARLYDSSRDGIARLPADCRPSIQAARLIYAEIGAEIARNGHDSVSRRAVVSRRRKLGLLAQALLSSIPPAGLGHPALEEVRFLLDAVTREPLRLSMAQQPVDHPGRIVRMLAIIEKAERKKRAAWPISQTT